MRYAYINTVQYRYTAFILGRIQYDHEVNSFKFWWFRKGKSHTTDAPYFDIINLIHLERDYINDIFKLDSFLDIKITVI